MLLGRAHFRRRDKDHRPLQDGWTPLGHHSDTRPDRRPGRTGVVRHSYSPANPHGWTTADDQRNASGMRSAAAAVRLGVRSRRPAGQARCPSWTAVRPGIRVVQPSARERPSDRQSRLEGAGEQDERALAIGEAALGADHPTVAAVRGNLEVVLPGPEGRTSDGLSRSSRNILAPWPTTVSCSSTSCPSSPGPPARRCANRSRRARSPSRGR
jgi:hypothetical protein